jgi:membrane protein DedA with SNARE-associated domain
MKETIISKIDIKDMPEEVIYYVTRYGYLAIFILVFLQETGMPNLFPNELLLLFSGYLSFKGLLYLPLVILTTLSADFIGTNILYYLFNYAGVFIMQKKPKWFPVSEGMMNKITAKISSGGKLSLFIFRLTPFTRGYASVIAGLLRIKANLYLPIALFSALTWASIYVFAGYIIGPSWDSFTQNLGNFKYFMLAGLALIISMFLLIYSIRERTKNKAKTS